MTTEYKIRIGTDERNIPGTILSYQDSKAGVISETAKTEEDLAVVEACRGLAKLLKSEEIEITIKAR